MLKHLPAGGPTSGPGQSARVSRYDLHEGLRVSSGIAGSGSVCTKGFNSSPVIDFPHAPEPIERMTGTRAAETQPFLGPSVGHNLWSVRPWKERGSCVMDAR